MAVEVLQYVRIIELINKTLIPIQNTIKIVQEPRAWKPPSAQRKSCLFEM